MIKHFITPSSYRYFSEYRNFLLRLQKNT